MLPDFGDDGIFFGNKDNGLAFTADGWFLYDKGEKRAIVDSDLNFLWNACQCQIEGSLPSGTYRLSEVELSICPKCGGLILMQKSTVYMDHLQTAICSIEKMHESAKGAERALLGEVLELLGGVTSGGTKG